MAKAKTQRVGKGEIRDEIMPLDFVQEKRRRHDAAVKANATRKARNAEKEGGAE